MDSDSFSQSSSLSLNSFQEEVGISGNLVNSEKRSNYYEASSNLKNDSGCDIHDESCDDLSHQSQCSLVEDNNFQSDLYALDEALELKVKVDYLNKIDNLLKINRQLESKLNSANDQIGRLLRNPRDETRSISKVNNHSELEKKHFQVMLQSSALQFKLSQIEVEKSEIENENKWLHTEINNFKIDLNMKNAVVSELKHKVSNQFAEIQKLTKVSDKRGRSLNEMESELQHKQNRYEWMKKQLKNHQQEKKSMLVELTKLKSTLINQNEKISLLGIDKEKILMQCEALKFEKYTKKQTKCENCEHISHSNNEYEKMQSIHQDINVITSNWYNENLTDLNNKISNLETLIDLKDQMFQNIIADYSSAVSQCITLQKTLQETSQAVESLKNENNTLKMEKSLISDQEKHFAELYEKTKTEENTLRLVVLRNQREKEDIETCVNAIRNQLTVFKMKFDSMNGDIAYKNKKISELHQEIQKLYMEKNWQICELDEMKSKEIVITQLKNEIGAHKKDIGDYSNKIAPMKNKLQRMELQYSDLKNEKNKLGKEHLKQIQQYEIVLQQYKNLLLDSETKYNHLEKSNSDYSTTISDLNIVIKDLKSELEHENSISEQNEMCNESENPNKKAKKSEYINDTSKNTRKYQCSNIGKHFENRNSNEKDVEIEKLKISLKVKDLDATEKQKKFETNTRTLLRKVKEQISERKAIEKQYADQVKNLKLLYETIKGEKESMMNVIFELQQKLKDTSVCSECLEYGMQMKFLQKNLEESTSSVADMKKMLGDCNKIIINLQKENQEVIKFNSELTSENKNWEKQCRIILREKEDWSQRSTELQQESDNNAGLVEELRESIRIEMIHHSSLRTHIDEKLVESTENQVLNTSSKNKIDKLVSNEKFRNMDIQISQLENEIQSVNSEKFFLQRLNNDLKFALREQMTYNKILKERKFEPVFVSFPNIKTTVQKYDENYINSLLQKTKMTAGEGNFSEMHSCLNSMRRDILAIQEDIVKKTKKL